MKNSATKALVIICGIVGFAAFAFAISFYYRDLPNTPQPDLGRIYPLNNHGYLLYMTHGEQVQQQASFAIFALLFVVVAVTNHFLDPFENNGGNELRRAQPWNHRWGP